MVRTCWSGLVAVMIVSGCTSVVGDAIEEEHEPPIGTRAVIVPPGSQGTITPVYFVPADRAYSEDSVARINVMLGQLRSWYDRELGDAQLRMGCLEVVYGARDSVHYRTDNNIWKEGPAELEAALGYSPWTPGHIVHLIGDGLGGWAGGNGSGQAGFSATAMHYPEECGTEWYCEDQYFPGTAIHELGHALTLPHSADPSIMSFHGGYEERVLLASEAYKVVNNTMFTCWDGSCDSTCN